MIGQRPPVEDRDDSPICASCGSRFSWDDAYLDVGGRGVPGHGLARPRAYCPHCGDLVAEWHLDLVNDFESWAWVGANASVNADRRLPPSPRRRWGRSMMETARE